MTNWQITAKTVYCDSVADEVTIIVKKDWSVQCTGCGEAAVPTGITGAASKKAGNCEGIKCNRVTSYVKHLLAEEN